MKNLICILIVSFTGHILSATTTPDPQSLNVMAFSGLKIRTAPNLEGQVLDVIPFGERIEILEKSELHDRIEWMSGNWIKVNYNGIVGYVFDGFVSELPVPSFNFELTSNDSEVVYPLTTYTQYRFEEIRSPDTLQSNGSERIIQYFNNEIVLKREESRYHLKTSLELSNSKISDAYNLVRSMLLTKDERMDFEEKTIFITNGNGEIDRIKVNLDSPIEIKKTPNQGVIINAVTFYSGC